MPDSVSSNISYQAQRINSVFGLCLRLHGVGGWKGFICGLIAPTPQNPSISAVFRFLADPPR
ncbi:hypothetical protein B0T16DRAFT_49623 [Cercophora newfieldiana]|uniref:Uncharacterized protein n=1 Tax=Cercophora newfieldiana TaxID=92897 RepID=A0AA39YQU4_9PEZI|nr:hypothetical protein B0T16DRAFT_49623 [Cercophora newfieldiana]